MPRVDILPEITFKDIEDPYVKESFSRLKQFLQGLPMLFGEFEFREIVASAAVTNMKVPHGLGFKPVDIIQTSKIGAGNITFNYDKFDKTFLDITTTGPCTVRAFVGAYRED
jgi:hypothetical protein